MADDAPKEEKTEDATPRRREEAREKGQVAFSTELVAAIMLLAAAGAFLFAGPWLVDDLGKLVVASAEAAPRLAREELSIPAGASILAATCRAILPAFLAAVLPVVLVGVLAGYGQVGFKIAPKAVSLDPAKIHPGKGLQRMFSARSFVRSGLSLAKILFIAASMAVVAWLHVGALGSLAESEPGPLIAASARILVRCAAAGVLAILAIALIDFAFQRRQHERDLRMSKHEVKDELKSTEGDPHVRARIRRIQREVASRRMMADVPKATVVITNPTHYAVALRYERSEARGAPRVVAKGVERVALRIRELAEEAGVPCYEDPPLARALHAQTEIGDQIPEDLFQAVAGVLAYVYGLQREGA